jgi:hypothetical protein
MAEIGRDAEPVLAGGMRIGMNQPGNPKVKFLAPENFYRRETF